MKVNRLLLIILVIILLTLFLPVAQAEGPQLINWDCYIPDEALNHALHDILGKAYSEPLNSGELSTITGHVDLHGLGIEDLTGLSYLVGADGFMLFQNEISELPELFCQMIVDEGVQVLHLSTNNLSALPSVLGNSSLVNLNLSNNEFYSVPSCVLSMSALKYLYMRGNRISTLPNGLLQPQLKAVDISVNRITSIPETFKYATLIEFDCHYNFIDFSAGAYSKIVIDTMNVTIMNYEYQLNRVEGLAAKYTATGEVKLLWELGNDIEFPSSVTAKLDKISILQDGGAIASVNPGITEYDIANLEVGREYEFSVAFVYELVSSGYVDVFTRSYTKIKATPKEITQPQTTTEPAEISAGESQNYTEPPSETEAVQAVEEPETPEEVEESSLTDGEDEANETAANEIAGDKTSGGISITLLIILGAVLLIFVIGFAVLLTLLIVKRKSKDVK